MKKVASETGRTAAKRARPARPTAMAEPRDVRKEEGTRWLLLIHQVPPKPDYLRVKIGRRLQKVGAVAIKNSVYVLPPGAEAYEDFRWIVAEIEDAGGEAFISEASLGEGLSDESVRARFIAVCNAEYRDILAEARTLLSSARGGTRSRTRRPPQHDVASHAIMVRELARLRRRHESVCARDFFGAPDGGAVETSLHDIDAALRIHGRRPRTQKHGARIDGATWVTRRDVHVDRIASAWLIRRFVDRHPKFRFVDPTRHTHRAGERRFDMFEGEYTHVGDACTFETLAQAFAPGDATLRDMGEIVHDVDCKDGKFGRTEAAGLGRMIDGIAALCARDDDRVERGARLFDELYAAFADRSRGGAALGGRSR